MPPTPTHPTPQPGDVLEGLRIDAFGHGGIGLSRSAEQVVFVTGAIPGDAAVSAQVTKVKVPANTGARQRPTLVWASATAVGEPATGRQPSICALAAHGAGCCDLDFVTPERSLELKRSVVLDQFARIGGVDRDTLDALNPTTAQLPPFTAYRRKVRLALTQEGDLGMRAAGSEAVVPLLAAEPTGTASDSDTPAAPPNILLCAQWDPALAAAVRDLCAHAEEQGWTSGIPAGHDVIVAVDAAGEVAVESTPHHSRAHRGDGGEKSHRRAAGGRGRRGRRPAPRRERRTTPSVGIPGVPREVTQEVGPLTLRLAASGFWQAHPEAVEHYSRWILEQLGAENTQDTRDTSAARSTSDSGAAAYSPRRAVGWDLYGGAGVFSLALRELCEEVISIDYASAASERGEQACQRAGIDDISFHRAAITPELIAGLEPHPDLILLDPPRTGAGTAVMEACAAAGPEAIVHIGCDPAAAARDCAALLSAGYTLEALHIVDAFGLTHHVETLTLLRRGRASEAMPASDNGA